MGKYDLFFKLAKEAGIEEAELSISESHSLSVSLFHSEIDNYKDENSMSIFARGKIGGKCGGASCDTWSKDKAAFLVKEIVKNAKVIENDDPIIIFKGSEKYHKVNTYNNELEKISIDDKIAKLYELEKAVKAFDKRVVDVNNTEYEESFSKDTIINTNGLKLQSKSNYFVYVSQAIAKDGEQTKTGYDLFLDNDFSKVNIQDLAGKIAKAALEQLNGEACPTGTYKAVLSNDVVAALAKVFASYADSEEVQKKSSLFIGKLGQKVASSKITIEDKPLAKSVYARWFDDEGVATSNKAIIKNGVLQTYLYNLTTAAKEGRESTGNGFGAGGKKGVDTVFLSVKPGKKSLEELFQEVGNGVYITEVSGLHAGLNPQSGNFSLQSTGFLIKDGKKDRCLDLITISGNILSVFKDIVTVGNDIKVLPSAISTPSIIIKKLSVGGK